VQHERVGVSAELCDDEWNALSHQAGYKSHVARQAASLATTTLHFAAFAVANAAAS
jgi:hypothetical protein